MAPQQDRRRKHGRFPHPTRSLTQTDDEDDFDTDDEDNDLPSLSVSSTFTKLPMVEPSMTTTGISSESSTTDYRTRTRQPVHPPYNGPTPGPHSEWPKTSSWETSTISPAQSENLDSTAQTASPTLIGSSSSTTLPSATSGDFGGPRPGQPWPPEHRNNAPLYAAASIIPIIVLAIIGAVLWICLRRRKRRREENDKVATQEMKEEPKPTVLSYVAPPVTAQRHSLPNQLPPTSTPSQLQPVILGPILSSSNGAYMTGMDTSDVVSITSNNIRPADPFADGCSLMEPPPPYRPSSVAPPSFVSTSRQSSLRTPNDPSSTSQTHLIERSPFEDPDDDVSEISGPTHGRGNDSTSTVSDVSYQYEPATHQSAF
ncbi:hypothetical protein J1614_007034 [Plenodomus biglobosus]|nr:hypothetical protein J1614_007034 [Plenodomus biglobosus]